MQHGGALGQALGTIGNAWPGTEEPSKPVSPKARRLSAQERWYSSPLVNAKACDSDPMKAVILAGGLGTRLAEETHLKPKPMVEVGGKPILWHILKTYSHYGINEFIICCGYKGYMIKEYFANYFLHTSDVTFHMDLNHMEIHKRNTEPWKVTLVDTGEFNTDWVDA